MSLTLGSGGQASGWKKLRKVMDAVLLVAERLRPDYITGHSLGGTIAETVASFTGIPGMSFNAPGPVGFITETPFLNPDKAAYTGIMFEAHLRENDPVSQVNYEHHINKSPIWHHGSAHGSDIMLRDIQRDMSVVVKEDAFANVAAPLFALNKRKEKEVKSKKKRFMKWVFRNEMGNVGNQ